MTVRRTTWFDWYVEDGEDGESAVLLGDTVVVLSPLATVLVDAVGDGASIEELAVVLEETFGSPEGVDVVEATRAAVDTLLESGVLEAACPPA